MSELNFRYNTEVTHTQTRGCAVFNPALDLVLIRSFLGDTRGLCCLVETIEQLTVELLSKLIGQQRDL